MLPVQCEAQVSTFLTSSQVVATLLVYRPHFTKRNKRLLKLISAVIDKIRYKLFPNNKQCQTLGRGGVGGGHGEVAAAVLGAALADTLAYRGRRD